ncbi:hypothetical protein BH11PSE11_BH11PSE11_21260 [soil metagenome]
MHLRIKTILSATLLSGAIASSMPLHAASSPAELGGFSKTYESWFDQAAAEFNVPVELLQAIAYAESRWQPIVPKGKGRKNGERSIEVDWHAGEMPPSYGVMGLRNDTHFGTSLTQAAKLIREVPETLVTDTRANIRGAAALLAQYGDRKTRDTPLEQWEEAVAKYSGIPEREIAELHTHEILSAIRDGRNSEHFRIRQRHVDLEKVYGKDKLHRLSSSRIIVDFGKGGTSISLPNQ